jgi:TolA-binding protein
MYTRLLSVALMLPMLGACATKRDLQDLQTEIGEMRAAQERLLREIQQQNASIVDSLQVQDIRLRGDFTNQLVQIERQIVQVQELTGQGQQRLAELREALDAREEEARRAAAAQAAAVQNFGSSDPDELFASAESALERGSTATARAGFEEFVESFPQHPLAAAARLNIAGLFEEDGDETAALEEYSRILELHPDAPEAATALLAAALLQREAGNVDRARSMLNQLTAAYPGSPEATTARDELRRMR